MTEAMVTEETEKGKKGAKGLILGVLGAVVFGVGVFFLTYLGIFPSAEGDSASSHAADVNDGHSNSKSGVTFIALDPLVISLGKLASSRHLRFQAYLEVDSAVAPKVEHLTPRVLDVLNTYLRAISEVELEDPASMIRLRAQMLRRVQIVVGAETVRDLLITEFVLN